MIKKVQPPNKIKICSFHPGGTETVYALGLGRNLVGVSHACDYPPEVRRKPRITTCAIDKEKMTSREIADTVSDLLGKGQSLRCVDTSLLTELQPDVLISHDCCYPGLPLEKPSEAPLSSDKVKFLSLSPRSLENIFENIRLIGEATDSIESAQKLVYQLRMRATAVQCKTFFKKQKPKVLVLDWLDPISLAGRWIPEMVEIAGGISLDGLEGNDSRPTDWGRIAEFNPDVLLYAPYGYHLRQALKNVPVIPEAVMQQPFNALKNRAVYAVDAASYLSRPGPRLIDGIELIAHILHPDICRWDGPSNAFSHVVFPGDKKQK
ncbi:MAG TPA: ABC transporter substrate-binding protein [Elusimicrobiota bacterium]|nr:ABC transporter substrate-binding protein [Elusimicrobiota bacterium]